MATILVATATSGVALAHKAGSNHTHCSVDGKGVAVEGKTDAERKASCGQVAGSKWDEKKAVKVEAAAAKAAPAPEKKEEAPAAEAAPAAPAEGASGGGW